MDIILDTTTLQQIQSNYKNKNTYPNQGTLCVCACVHMCGGGRVCLRACPHVHACVHACLQACLCLCVRVENR